MDGDTHRTKKGTSMGEKERLRRKKTDDDSFDDFFDPTASGSSGPGALPPVLPVRDGDTDSDRTHFYPEHENHSGSDEESTEE